MLTQHCWQSQSYLPHSHWAFPRQIWSRNYSCNLFLSSIFHTGKCHRMLHCSFCYLVSSTSLMKNSGHRAAECSVKKGHYLILFPVLSNFFSCAINLWGQEIMKSFQQVDFDTGRAASPSNDKLSQALISSHGRTDESSKKWQMNRLLNDKEKIRSKPSERQILIGFNGRGFFLVNVVYWPQWEMRALNKGSI